MAGSSSLLPAPLRGSEAGEPAGEGVDRVDALERLLDADLEGVAAGAARTASRKRRWGRPGRSQSMYLLRVAVARGDEAVVLVLGAAVGDVEEGGIVEVVGMSGGVGVGVGVGVCGSLRAEEHERTST